VRTQVSELVNNVPTAGLFEVPAAWCLNSTSHATIEP